MHDWFSPQQDYQLVIHDETLAVLILVVSEGAVARAFQQARDLMNVGHLTVAQVRQAASVVSQPSNLTSRGSARRGTPRHA